MEDLEEDFVDYDDEELKELDFDKYIEELPELEDEESDD